MTKERLSRVVEALMVVALLAGTGWLGQLVQHNYVTHGEPEFDGVRFAPTTLPARSVDGEAAPVLLGEDRPELLLVLSTTCAFCQENMPNWRLLTEELQALGAEAPRVTVLSVSPAADTREFLAEHGLDVPVRLIDRAVLELLGIGGYPTTVAVDAGTRSLAAWSGVLVPAKREVVLAWAGASMPSIAAADSISGAGPTTP